MPPPPEARALVLGTERRESNVYMAFLEVRDSVRKRERRHLHHHDWKGFYSWGEYTRNDFPYVVLTLEATGCSARKSTSPTGLVLTVLFHADHHDATTFREWVPWEQQLDVSLFENDLPPNLLAIYQLGARNLWWSAFDPWLCARRDRCVRILTSVFRDRPLRMVIADYLFHTLDSYLRSLRHPLGHIPPLHLLIRCYL